MDWLGGWKDVNQNASGSYCDRIQFTASPALMLDWACKHEFIVVGNTFLSHKSKYALHFCNFPPESRFGGDDLKK